jgi:hypothetical protein
MSSETEQTEEMPGPDFGREERRLARLRLVVDVARPEQEQPDDFEPDPREAA